MKKSKTAYEIVKEYFPDADDSIIEYIIWDKTGYPEFFIPKENEKTNEDVFRRQLLEYKNEIEVAVESKGE